MTAVVGPTIEAGEVLVRIEALLDQVDPDRGQVAADVRLEWVRLARRVCGRLDALASMLLAEADAVDASMRITRTPMSSWLGLDGKLSKREAAGAVHRARELAARPELAAAATDGRVGPGQVRAIGRLLDRLAPQLDAEEEQAAETLLLDLATELDADQLSRASDRVLAAVAPSQSDERVETRLQREVEQAEQDRSLRWWRDAGSIRFDGSLPRLEGEAWIVLLDAHAESLRRTASEQRDPIASTASPQQRRADALIAMIRQHQGAGQAPTSGGERPRVVVTVDYGKLRADAAAAGVVAGESLSAGELRRMCCDADILPAVLAGDSQVLDIGRETRAVPAGIRAGLVLRDGGCVFPGCSTRPAVCEAHHIMPWWSGGATALSNLVLLCHHHHALVEPARYGLRDQWQVGIADDGVPEFTPPARFDQERRPLRHRRFDRTDPVIDARPPDGNEASSPESGRGSSRSGPADAA